MITGDCQCPEQCGRRASCNGPEGVVYSDTCWQRWRRAGKPETGPPPGRQAAEPEPDPEDVEPDPAEIAARWEWVDPEVRRGRAVPAAAEMVRLVRVKDRQGVETLLDRFTDWGALLIVLAGWVEPARAARKDEAAA